MKPTEGAETPVTARCPVLARIARWNGLARLGTLLAIHEKSGSPLYFKNRGMTQEAGQEMSQPPGIFAVGEDAPVFLSGEPLAELRD
ncbi:MAG: hypothetical protein F4Y03_08715 [Alphaproteobacteria bacterium]|nr:hypothetical protein [Alphaproteobacteria bacterium]